MFCFSLLFRVFFFRSVYVLKIWFRLLLLLELKEALYCMKMLQTRQTHINLAWMVVLSTMRANRLTLRSTKLCYMFNLDIFFYWNSNDQRPKLYHNHNNNNRHHFRAIITVSTVNSEHDIKQQQFCIRSKTK